MSKTTKKKLSKAAAAKKGLLFDPSQNRVYRDDSRVIAVCWHRQKGKDYVSAAKAVIQAMAKGETWYIVSLTQRQADETFEKCKLWAKKYRDLFKEWGREEAIESGFDIVEHDKQIDEQFVFRARELKLPNGGRVVSLPGRSSDTLAGFSGNIIFTEFGLFPNGGYDHWRVVFPLATRGFCVMAISTPRGKDTKFYDLVSDPETYSVHVCDIHKSVAEDGFVLRNQKGEPCSIDEFRKLYGDDIGWQREYECKFMGTLSTLLKWGQLEEASKLGEGRPFDLLRITGEAGWRDDFFKAAAECAGGRFEMGWDVARRHDFSSLWINHAVPGGPRSLRYLVLMKDVSFALQREVIDAAMRLTPKGGRLPVGCGDSTGLGMDSNETFSTRFGKRWEGVNFSRRRKSELGSTGLTVFDECSQAIPSMRGEHKFIATDLYAVQRDDSGGNLKLVESENPLLPDSHCDIAYSAFLAQSAGSLAGVTSGLMLI